MRVRRLLLGVLSLAIMAVSQAGAEEITLRPMKPWTKVCGKERDTNREVCYTTNDFGTATDQPPVLAVAVYDFKDDDTKIVRLLLPNGLQMRPGFRFWIDQGSAIEGTYEICFPNGCFGEAKVKSATIATMKRGMILNVSVRNQNKNEVEFKVPLNDFGKAYDGPPIDPKLLADLEKSNKASEPAKPLQGAAPTAVTPPPSATGVGPQSKPALGPPAATRQLWLLRSMQACELHLLSATARIRPSSALQIHLAMRRR
jgi:invasion protein IalB